MDNKFDELVLNHYLEALKEHTSLKAPIKSTDGSYEIFGRIDVKDGLGNNWATYDVRILIPVNYPDELPVLFELAGEIERTGDWHISHDQSCCLGPRVKLVKELDNNVNILRWINLQVIPFLANHIYKIKTGEYADKEYSHGSEGILQYYREMWDLRNDRDIIKKLKWITRYSKYERNAMCFCGSGNKYKNCHWTSREFEGVPIKNYERDLRDLIKHM